MLGIQELKSRLWYITIFKAYVKPLVLADSCDFWYFGYMVCGDELRFENSYIKRWISWYVTVAPTAVWCVPCTLGCSGVTYNSAVTCLLFTPCFLRLQPSSEFAHPLNSSTLTPQWGGTSLGDMDLQAGAKWRCLPVWALWDVWPWCFTGDQWQGTETAIKGRVWHELGGVRWSEVVAQSDDGVWCDTGPAVASLSGWTGYLPVLTLPKPCNKQEHAEYHKVLPYCFWPIKQYLTLTTCKSKKKARKESTKHKIMHLHLCCLT